ncbi:MAG: hypothetical protein AAF628_11585 [Planctomycetota bacterium]
MTGEDINAGNLGQIRTILFGEELKRTETRFGELEQRLEQGLTQLRTELDTRLSQLDQFVRQELSSLAQGLKSEHDERRTRLEDVLSRIADQEKLTAERLESAIAELQTEMQQRSVSLSDEKIGRDDLAALLADVAHRLNGNGKAKKKSG